MKKLKNKMLLAALLPLAGFGAAGKPYNVLIIHTDEHNFRTLGCYRRVLPEKEALMWGSTVVETPHIDSLAERGMVADSFYCASPICSPSRASFVSGLYPMDAGVIENDVPLRAETETFAEALRRAGYATGYAGKWHLAGMQSEILRTMTEKAGKPAKNIYSFPEFYNGWVPPEQGMGFADNRFMWDTGHWKKIVSNPSGNPTMIHPGQIGDEKTFTTDWLTDRAMEFMEEHKAGSFCFMVSMPDPHGPDSVREPYASMYKNVEFKVPYTALADSEAAPSWGKPGDNEKSDDAAYFGMVKCIDDNVGRLLKKLDELGLTDRTVIVFTSDHGDMRGEHGRQNKGVPFEASAKIPFVIQAPGLIPANSRTAMALNTVDFKPTLLGLLGVRAEKPSQGRDASAILRGRPVAKEWNNLIFSRSPGKRTGSAWLMATDGRYKLVVSPLSPVWLIDLKNDPAEMTNLAGNPELKPVVSRMAGALLDYAVKYDDPNLEQVKLRSSLEAAAGK